MDGSDCFEDQAAFFCDNGGSIEADGEKNGVAFQNARWGSKVFVFIHANYAGI